MFVSRPIDLAAEYAKVDDELKEINDPLMQVNAMKHKLVAERLDHQRTKLDHQRTKEERLEERDKFEKKADENLKMAVSAEKDKDNERAERMKDIVCPAIRTEFEEFEQLHLPANKLSKKDMIQDIQKSNPNFVIPSSIAEVEELSLHYVSMRYILKNCQDAKVLTFKNHLKYSKGYNDDLIARSAGIFYKKSSSATHNILVDMTVKDVESALRKYGINDNDTITIATTLYAVRRDKINELN